MATTGNMGGVGTGQHNTGMLHTGSAMAHTDRGVGRQQETFNEAPVAAAPVAAEPVGGTRGGVVGTRGGKAGKVVNGLARTLLLLTQLLTLLAFLAVLGGLGYLQHKANHLKLTGAQLGAYPEIFQSGNQVPYPNSSDDQFAFQWYILAVEIFVTLIILAMVCLPMRALERLKLFAACLLTYAFVLTTLQIQSLLYFRRSPVANTLFGKAGIRWTLGGAIAGAICNALSLLFLSLLRQARRDREPAYGVGGKRVGSEPGYGSGYDNEGGVNAV